MKFLSVSLTLLSLIQQRQEIIRTLFGAMGSGFEVKPHNHFSSLWIEKRYNLLKDKVMGTLMLSVEEIETAILQLPPEQFRQLSDWFFELDEQRWDEQLEQDIAEGKLEFLAQEAIAEFEAGRCQQI